MDEYWAAAASFLGQWIKPDDLVVVPQGFDTPRGIEILSYDDARRTSSAAYIVVHKGLLEGMKRSVVRLIVENMVPIFANEVFVIFAKGDHPAARDRSEPHVNSFYALARRIIDVCAPTSGRFEIGEGVQRVSHYLGDGRVLISTRYGHKMILVGRDLSITPHLVLDGVWEEWVTNVFRRLVRPGMVVVDVGANQGYYSLLAAAAIRERGRIFSFEPNPKLSDLVFANLALNGYLQVAEVVEKAVFSHDCIVELMEYQRFLGSSSLWADKAHVEMFHDQVVPRQVEAVALDSFFPAGSTVDYVKIDAEGSEPFVLDGGKRLWEENPDIVVQMEFAPAILQVTAGNLEDFWTRLKTMGLDALLIRTDSRLEPCDLKQLLEMEHSDILLCRKDRARSVQG
jgi:FkbM family methyltransferase